jgi:nickel-dependent lactate racemase
MHTFLNILGLESEGVTNSDADIDLANIPGVENNHSNESGSISYEQNMIKAKAMTSHQKQRTSKGIFVMLAKCFIAHGHQLLLKYRSDVDIPSPETNEIINVDIDDLDNFGD